MTNVQARKSTNRTDSRPQLAIAISIEFFGRLSVGGAQEVEAT